MRRYFYASDDYRGHIQVFNSERARYLYMEGNRQCHILTQKQARQKMLEALDETVPSCSNDSWAVAFNNGEIPPMHELMQEYQDCCCEEPINMFRNYPDYEV